MESNHPRAHSIYALNMTLSHFIQPYMINHSNVEVILYHFSSMPIHLYDMVTSLSLYVEKHIFMHLFNSTYKDQSPLQTMLIFLRRCMQKQISFFPY